MESDPFQVLMMVAGLGILCWLMLRRRMKRGMIGLYHARNKRERIAITPDLKHNSNAQLPQASFTGVQSLGAPTEVLKWQVELHDLGRELKAELDSKMIAVRTLTKQYDHAANRLSELIRLAEAVNVDAAPTVLVARLRALGLSTEQISATLNISVEQCESLESASEKQAAQPSSPE